MARHSASQGISNADRRAAIERAVDLLMPEQVPFACRDRIADEEFGADWIVPRGYVATGREDVKSIVLKIGQSFSETTALDSDSETHKAVRAKLSKIAEECAALAERFDELEYEHYFLLHAHGRLHQRPEYVELHDLYEGVKDWIAYAGTPSRHPAGHSCKLAEDLARVSNFLLCRAALISGSRGSTTVARQFIPSAQWLLINDCWSVWRVFGKPEPRGTVETEFHEFIRLVAQWTLGRVDTGYDNLLKKFVPLRRRLDELGGLLNAYADRLSFASIPDMRDRASELVRAARHLGDAVVSEIRRMLDEYLVLRERIEKGERVTDLDRAGGVEPVRDTRSRSPRNRKRQGARPSAV